MHAHSSVPGSDNQPRRQPRKAILCGSAFVVPTRLECSKTRVFERTRLSQMFCVWRTISPNLQRLFAPRTDGITWRRSSAGRLAGSVSGRCVALKGGLRSALWRGRQSTGFRLKTGSIGQERILWPKSRLLTSLRKPIDGTQDRGGVLLALAREPLLVLPEVLYAFSDLIAFIAAVV
jgi:hypothetical protein